MIWISQHQYQVLISKAFDIREIRLSSPGQHTDVASVLPQIQNQGFNLLRSRMSGIVGILCLTSTHHTFKRKEGYLLYPGDSIKMSRDCIWPHLS